MVGCVRLVRPGVCPRVTCWWHARLFACGSLTMCRLPAHPAAASLSHVSTLTTAPAATIIATRVARPPGSAAGGAERERRESRDVSLPSFSAWLEKWGTEGMFSALPASQVRARGGSSQSAVATQLRPAVFVSSHSERAAHGLHTSAPILGRPCNGAVSHAATLSFVRSRLDFWQQSHQRRLIPNQL